VTAGAALFAAGVVVVFALDAGATIKDVPSIHLQGSTADVHSGDCSGLNFSVYGIATYLGSFQATVQVGYTSGPAYAGVTWSASNLSTTYDGFASAYGTGTCGPSQSGGVSLTMSITTSNAYVETGGVRTPGTFTMTLALDNAYSSGNSIPVSFAADFTPGASPPPSTTSGPVSTAATTTATTALTTTAAETTTVEGPTTAPAPVPRPRLVLPRFSLTPGVKNPAVRQSTIHTTICVTGWTKTIRPPASYTNELKRKQMKQYGESGSPTGYEEDHLLPLELGGASRNPKNFWPEPHRQSARSDPLETTLKTRVCAGTLTLAAARRQILSFKRTNG
jgi:hypothetical protein